MASTTALTTPESATTTTSTIRSGMPLTQSCTNTEGRYQVGFPEGWYTNEGRVVPPCRYFHPEPFEVPPQTEVVGLAVSVGVDNVEFARVTQGEPHAERQLSREEITVAGRQAVRIEARSTGEALLPDGVRGYRYHVDVEGGTLTAATYDVDDLDYEENKRVLDRMMETVELNIS